MKINGNNIDMESLQTNRMMLLSIADHEIKVQNALFDLFIKRFEVWVNGQTVEATIDGVISPLEWQHSQILTIHCSKSLGSDDLVKVFFFDSQIGPLIFSNEHQAIPVPTADHKQSIFQFFRSDFQVDLLLDARKVLGKTSQQKRGFAFYPFTSTQEIKLFLEKKDEFLSKSLGSVKPDLLGLSFSLPIDLELLESFCDLCNTLKCEPVFHFQSALDLAQITTLLQKANELLISKDNQQTGMILSIHADNTDETAQQLCESLLGDFPNLTIFLNDPALFRLTNQPANPLHKLINGGRVIPTLSRVEPGPTGWFAGDKAQEKDFASALAYGFDQYLKKVRAILQSNHLEDSVRIAIDPWSFFRSPTADETGYDVNLSAQDAFYYAGMVSRLLKANNLVSHALAGPLIGKAGLLRVENGTLYPSAVFPFFQMMQELEENILGFEMMPNRPVPDYFWSGIKGAVDAVDLPIVEGFATRSNDGSKIFLSVVNRSPRKRAVIRISFANFENMRPLKAGVIRRNRNQDRNFADKSDNVKFAEISVRKYRRMDHVNLDIPASGIASMVLTTES